MARKIPAEAKSYWTYVDASSSVLFRVQRFDRADGSKEFNPFRNDPDGWRIKGLRDNRPLYHLDELADAEAVVVLEGEKCADLIRALKLTTTTSANGAKSADKTDWSPLAGKIAYIVPDNDEPGKKYAQDVASILLGLTPKPTVKIVQLPLKNKRRR